MDTAFTGGLTLPSGILSDIGAVADGRVRSQFANGVEDYCVSASVDIVWHDGERVAAEAIVLNNGLPLLGTELLEGSHLDLEAQEGGQVLIEPM